MKQMNLTVDLRTAILAGLLVASFFVFVPFAHAATCTPAQVQQGMGTYVMPNGAQVCATSYAQAQSLYAANPSAGSLPTPISNPPPPLPGSTPPPTNAPAATAGSSGGSIDCDKLSWDLIVQCKISEGLKQMGNDALGLGEHATMWTVWWVLAMTARIFFFAANILLWFGMSLLDMTTYFLVINMGGFIQNTQATGIHMAWQILRDLGNIAIIAGFVAVGISTILQIQNYNANRFLARLIIAALLINFSYYIAGAVIDASNFIATQIYTSEVMVGAAGNTPGGAGAAGCQKMPVPTTLSATGISSPSSANGGSWWNFSPDYLCSISSSFTTDLQLATWNDVKNMVGQSTSEFTPFGTLDGNRTIFMAGMLAGLFIVVTGYVLFSAAILLLGRFVVLIILLVTSPIGVAGSNIPFLDQYAKRWWTALFGQAMFAPMYFLLVAISLTIIRDLKHLLVGDATNGIKYANLVLGSHQDAINTIPLVITFMISIGFMYAALTIARTMSKSGEEYFGQIYAGLDKSLGGIYGNLYQGTAARALRLPSTAYDLTVGQIAKYRLPVPGGLALQHALSSFGQALRGDPNAKPFGATKTRAELAKESDEYTKSLPGTGAMAAQFLRHPRQTPIDIGKGIVAWAEGVYEYWTSPAVHDLFVKAKKHREDPKNNPEPTPAEVKRMERSVQAIKLEDIAKLSGSETELMLPFMSPAQAKAVFEREDWTNTQRTALRQARWGEALNKDTSSLRLTELMEDMTAEERKLFFVENEDKKVDQKMLAALSGKNFDEVTADRTIFKKTEADAARDTRNEINNKILLGSDNDAREAVLKRSSDDDIKGRSFEVVIDERVLSKMSIHQRRLWYQNFKGTDVQREEFLQRHEKLGGKRTDITSSSNPSGVAHASVASPTIVVPNSAEVGAASSRFIGAPPGPPGGTTPEPPRGGSPSTGDQQPRGGGQPNGQPQRGIGLSGRLPPRNQGGGATPPGTPPTDTGGGPKPADEGTISDIEL